MMYTVTFSPLRLRSTAQNFYNTLQHIITMDENYLYWLIGALFMVVLLKGGLFGCAPPSVSKRFHEQETKRLHRARVKLQQTLEQHNKRLGEAAGFLKNYQFLMNKFVVMEARHKDDLRVIARLNDDMNGIKKEKRRIESLARGAETKSTRDAKDEEVQKLEELLQAKQGVLDKMCSEEKMNKTRITELEDHNKSLMSMYMDESKKVWNLRQDIQQLQGQQGHAHQSNLAENANRPDTSSGGSVDSLDELDRLYRRSLEGRRNSADSLGSNKSNRNDVVLAVELAGVWDSDSDGSGEEKS